jgi:AcrR family transcriptional regulator
MARRHYRLGKRATTAAETRQRIVEATFALHSEQGINATTMNQIAERADVSVGTVYHHFPTYDEAVEACGVHAAVAIAPPDAAIFAGLPTLAERVERLASEVFASYRRLPGYERIKIEANLRPVVRRFVAAEERRRAALVRAAIRPFNRDERRVATVSALLDVAVLGALDRAGLGPSEAAARIAEIILAWLGPPGQPTQPDQPKDRRRRP